MKFIFKFSILFMVLLFSQSSYCSATPADPAHVLQIDMPPLQDTPQHAPPLHADSKQEHPFHPQPYPLLQVPQPRFPLEIANPDNTRRATRYRKGKHRRCFGGEKNHIPMRCIGCVISGIAFLAVATTVVFPVLEKFLSTNHPTPDCTVESFTYQKDACYKFMLNCGECDPIESADFIPPFCPSGNQTMAQQMQQTKKELEGSCKTTLKMCPQFAALSQNQTRANNTNLDILKTQFALCAQGINPTRTAPVQLTTKKSSKKSVQHSKPALNRRKALERLNRTLNVKIGEKARAHKR